MGSYAAKLVALIRSDLEQGEQIVVGIKAFVPGAMHAQTTAATGAAFGGGSGDEAARSLDHLREATRAAAESLPFPVVPQMVFGLTDRRLAVWAMSALGKPKHLLGSVGRSGIRSATVTSAAGFPRMGHLTLGLADGPDVIFEIPGGHVTDARRFCESLSAV